MLPPMATSNIEVAARHQRTRSYHKMFARLPAEVQQLAREAYQRFRDNPADPRLRRHRIHRSVPGGVNREVWSVSLDRRYRSLYYLEAGIHVWFWVGSHEQFNNLAV
jgi:hypothetical protein